MTLLCGDRTLFAIEAHVEERVDGWVLGHFRLWIAGHDVGDWSDTADLCGCARWLRIFAAQRQERYQPGLFHRTIDEVFQLVFDPVMATAGEGLPSVPPIEDPFARFNISQIGMSSLDEFDVLLLEDERGHQRCLWRNVRTLERGEAFFPPGTMEDVAGKFCVLLSEDCARAQGSTESMTDKSAKTDT